MNTRAVCLRLPEEVYQACKAAAGDSREVPTFIRQLLAQHFDINLAETQRAKRDAQALLRDSSSRALLFDLISKLDTGEPAANLAGKLADAISKRAAQYPPGTDPWHRPRVVLFHACKIEIQRHRRAGDQSPSG